MNKPITIAADDLRKELISIINESGLPMFIVESLVKDLLQDVHIAAIKQLENDRVIYESELKKTNSDEVHV